MRTVGLLDQARDASHQPLIVDGAFSRQSQLPNNLPLPMRRHVPIAIKSRQHTFMPQILAPGFELFGRLATFLAQADECAAQAVRVEVG